MRRLVLTLTLVCAAPSAATLSDAATAREEAGAPIRRYYERHPEAARHAQAQPTTQAREEIWATWIGSKYGTTINYPQSRFTLLPEPDAHDGRTFVSHDGARIAAFAYFNDGKTIASIDASLQDSPEYGHVIFRRRGARSTVTSGSRVIDGQEQVFYEKYFLEPGGEVVHAVVITYPVTTKGVYGRLISRIAGPLETSNYQPLQPVQGQAPVTDPGVNTQAQKPAQPGYKLPPKH